MKSEILLGWTLFSSLLGHAETKTWIGAANNNWADAESWSPSGVPVAADDVVFNASTTVLFTANVSAIKSLKVTNNSTVFFLGQNPVILGQTAGEPLTIDAGSTLQIKNLRLELNGASLVNGLLDMISYSQAEARLYAQVGSTATITINGKVRVGTEKIGGIDYDAAGLFGTGAKNSVFFNSGSEYEIARNSGLSGITPATWAPDAILRITGGSATDSYGLFWHATSGGHEIGTFIWDCPNQGSAANLAFGIYPFVTTIKGDFIINNSNGKPIRFTSSGGGNYTILFQKNFEVKSASTVLELFSAAATANGSNFARLEFEKNVSCAGTITSGANTSANHLLVFKGSGTGGLAGSGPQSLGINALAKAWDISIEGQNGILGIQLTMPLGKILNCQNAIMMLGNHNFFVAGNGGQLIGNNNFITNGSGYLIVPAAANTPTVYPVAASEESNDMLTITPAGNDTFSVRVKDVFAHPVSNAAKVYNREWNIASSSTNAQIQFQPCYCATEPTETGNLVIGQYKNGAWTETASTDSQLFQGTFNSFSSFGVGYAGGFVGSAVITTYTFTGSGNWSDPANWSNNSKPPATITSSMKVIIAHAVDGFCVLDVPITVNAGSNITVNPGKNLVINGNLNYQ